MLIREVLGIFRRWLWLIAIGVAIAAVLGFIQARRNAPSYLATAGVVVIRENFEVKLEPRFESTTDNPLAADQRQTDSLRTLAVVAANRAIANPVYADIKDSLPPGWDEPSDLAGRISAQVLDGVIQISARAEEPELAAILADAWAKRYADYVNRLYAGKSVETNLATQVEDAKSRYQEADAALIEFNRANNLDQLQVQLTEKQAMLEEILLIRRSELTGEIGALNARRSQLARLNTNARLLAELLRSNESSAASVANTLGLMFLQLAAVEQVPQVTAGRAITGTVFSSQGNLQFNFAPQRLDELVTSPEQLGSDIDNLIRVLEAEIATSAERLTALQETAAESSSAEGDPIVAAMLADLRALRAKFEELRSLRQQLEQTRNLLWNSYDVLASGAEEIQVTSSASDSSVVRFAIPAAVPRRPTGVGAVQNAFFAAIIGFMLSAVIVFVIEFLDDKVRSRQDVEEVLGLSVFGLVPKGGLLRRGVRLEDGRSPSQVLEAARFVRARLEAVEGSPRSFVFTGMKPGDGNTTIVSHVAMVMAQSGRQVIAVDANVRSPRLHDVFGLSSRQGLTTLLADASVPLESVLQPTGVSNLRVLAAGPVDAFSADLLNTPRVAAVLAAIRELADVIVVDVAAIGTVTDALSIVEHVDGVVMVLRSGASSVSAVEHARDGILAAKGNLVGAVLNGAPEGRGLYNNRSRSSEPTEVSEMAPS